MRFLSLPPLLAVSAATTLLFGDYVAANNNNTDVEIVQGTLRIYNDSYPVTYRRATPPSAPRSRYPGFKPSTVVLKAGTVRREGSRPLTCDIIFERDVAVTLRDGTTIYTDVFRPVGDEKVPAIVAWSPYGKQVGAQWLDDVSQRGGVPQATVSDLQKFEGPDPAYWVAQGYAVLNPDARGGFSSEGHVTYWDDKRARLERIQVPAYIVASYTNTLHTHGSFEAFRSIGSANKWLRVHNSSEWPEYYEPRHTEDLRRFFDHHLKDVPNGWPATPRVRLAVLDPGRDDTLGRAETDWPVPGLQSQKLFLHGNSTLGAASAAAEASVAYAANGTAGVEFSYEVPRLLELIGYAKLRLWVEAVGSDDMDLAVSVEKRGANGTKFTSASGGGETSSSYAATGYLRVSHRALDRNRSTPFEPYHTHAREERLAAGEVVAVDIGLWPTALRFHAGERLVVTVAAASITPATMDAGFGTAVVPVPADGANVSLVRLGGPLDSNPAFVDAQRVATPESRNAGAHVLHLGGRFDSHLLMPFRLCDGRSDSCE
ncbi:hypothetical protein SLS56_004251 [Neofusicoccum ribis]|uniref:Xaa-Pro dipeptidyl-peptidase C-terminal domain-containing protein n=1 Tax=Neofusicoccum ribis TaxID=45134 RepID=A0ABR3SX32_9PEZI